MPCGKSALLTLGGVRSSVPSLELRELPSDMLPEEPGTSNQQPFYSNNTSNIFKQASYSTSSDHMPHDPQARMFICTFNYKLYNFTHKIFPLGVYSVLNRIHGCLV